MTLLMCFVCALILLTCFVPFIENKYNDSEIRIVFWLLFCTLIAFLIAFKKNSSLLNRWKDQKKTEKLADFISKFPLSFEEAEVINSSSGWGDRGIDIEILNSDQLKSAFQLAKRKRQE